MRSCATPAAPPHAQHRYTHSPSCVAALHPQPHMHSRATADPQPHMHSCATPAAPHAQRAALHPQPPMRSCTAPAAPHV
eukprot:572071-Prorocentrum_minimum.AAC.6